MQARNAGDSMTAPALEISCDPGRLDLAAIHQYLSLESGWARGISVELVARSIEHSLCFGAYLGQQQIGFARVISDHATFANLVDVYVLQQFRGRGYSKQLMQAVIAHPQLQGLRRFTLATADAHGLYAQFGFTAVAKPQSYMERYDPDVYRGRGAGSATQ